VIINVKDDAAVAEKLVGYAEELKNVFIVSGVEVSENTTGDFSSDYFADKLTYTIAKADGDKCERCWSYSETVGKNAEHPTLCSRCAKEVNN
ncbi:MAG: hypothetical protein J6J52_01725, partial [Oscillospiraceae bacterium]|nr:hypothetical protein [Oscillospiraceae bacterium]